MRRWLSCVVALLLWIGVAPALAEGQTLYANVSPGSVLNGRSEPDRQSSRECYFTSGEELTATGNITDGWAEVIGGETGKVWVSVDYVSDTPPDENSTEGRAAEISCNGRVALRDKPDGKRVDWLHSGDSVTVYATLDGWARVDGGWVAEEYVCEAETEDAQWTTES